MVPVVFAFDISLCIITQLNSKDLKVFAAVDFVTFVAIYVILICKEKSSNFCFKLVVSQTASKQCVH